MSRRCLICSNLNPCQEHSEQAQDAELSRNSRAARELQATTPVAQGDEVRDAIKDFRWRAEQCRTNNVAHCPEAASVWDLAADALEGKP